jgi:hypothetical protein
LKKPALKSVKKKAWDLMSQWVRRKDADEGGTTQCFTCDRLIDWKYESQAGHAIGGRKNAVLLDEAIIRPQCYPCNAKHIGNGRYDVFIRKLIELHGIEWMQKKSMEARQPKKMYVADYEEIIADLKMKLHNLDNLCRGCTDPTCRTSGCIGA